MVARAGGICELCRSGLMEDDKFIGQIAHIRGSRRGSARHDQSMSDTERNASENLILLCNNCHARVDRQPRKYSAEHLMDMKQRHESKLKATVVREMPDIEFPELDEVVRHIAATDIPPEYSYTLIPPGEKIRKNHLSSKFVVMGLSQAGTVGRYVDKHLDAESARRLRAGFVRQYGKLRSEGLDGDDLFAVLWQFASLYKVDPKMQAAGLALLVYLFEKCEVFER